MSDVAGLKGDLTGLFPADAVSLTL